MSIIRAQAFRYSFINYLATGVAAISTLWIYPLDLVAYGLAQLLVSFASLCIPFATLGTLSVVVKFFPAYKNLGLRKSYLFNLLILGFGTLLLAVIVAIFINRPVLKFLEFLTFDSYVVAKHKYVIVMLIGITLYNNILMLHASNYNKIAVPSTYQNLIPKFVLPILIVAVYFEMIDMALFTKLWALSFLIASAGLTFYLWRIGGLDLKPQLTFFRRERFKELAGYWTYMGVGTLGGMLAGRIDLIMIGTLLGLKETGVYGMALFIGNVLVIPATGIWQIASPVISEAFSHNNWERIKEVYQKSSTNLLVTGVFVYFFILGTLNAVLTLSPNYTDIAVAVPIFAVIGLSKLIEMGASVNQYILMYSPKYRSVLVFVLIMSVMNIVLNYYLITNMYILGAAISTCVTTYLYQLVKCFYIEKEYGIQPLTKMTWRILILFFIVMLYFLLLPTVASPIIQAMIYASGLVVLYYLGIRLLKIKSDATDALEEQLARMLSKIRGR